MVLDYVDFLQGEVILLTAVLTPAEEVGFVALNPETGTTTQGETVEEAVKNLREPTDLFLEEFPSHQMPHPVPKS
jgi:predicted RNase H-like HicB family nuclease